MNNRIALLAVLLCCALLSPAQASERTTADAELVGDFCFFPGLPPADLKYRVVKKIKLGKGTYGSVRDILPALAQRAQTLGADAIINYAGSQRFGFFPWRFVRPVARGTAVQWLDPAHSQAHECTNIGGTTLDAILEANKSPGMQ